MKRRTRILVADDDAAICKRLAARLAAFGYELTPMEAEALLDACGASDVRAIVLERDRRRENGPSLVAELRRRVDVPIVFLSRRDREEFRHLVIRLPEVYVVPAGLADCDAAHRLRLLIGPPPRQPAEV